LEWEFVPSNPRPFPCRRGLNALAYRRADAARITAQASHACTSTKRSPAAELVVWTIKTLSLLLLIALLATLMAGLLPALSGLLALLAGLLLATLLAGLLLAALPAALGLGCLPYSLAAQEP
jgi:hypothetical protein